MSLSELRSVLLNKSDRTGFAHLSCASVDELKKCILDIAKREKEYYDDLIKIAPEFRRENLVQFEEKYGTFDEMMDYTPTDSQMITSALLHELNKKRK